MNIKKNIEIDNDAKIQVNLIRRTDINGSFFYTGKLQFNGTLSLSLGQSFIIFLSEKDVEEMQIGPLNPLKASGADNSVLHSNSRISLRLKKHQDVHDNDYFVGELKGVGDLDMKNGLFFTVFTSVPGREELQISPLKVNKKPFNNHHDLEFEDEDEEGDLKVS